MYTHELYIYLKKIADQYEPKEAQLTTREL